MRTHTTKDGQVMLLSEMTDAHLRRTIAFLERRAREGVRVDLHSHLGIGLDLCSDADDFDFYGELTVYGREALDALGYRHYVEELEKRRGSV